VSDISLLQHHAQRLLTPDELSLLGNAPLYGPGGLRRWLAEEDFYAFVDLYFGDELTVRPLPAVHHRFMEDIQRVGDRLRGRLPGLKLVRAVPRGMSKSTYYGRLGVLWLALTGRSPLSVLIGSNQTAAERLLINVKTAAESNPALEEDFGRLSTDEAWGSSKLIFSTGAVVVAYGAGSGAIRGTSTGAARPSYVLLDDVDTDSASRSAVEVDALKEWLTKGVLALGDQVTGTTSYVMLGTLLSRNSLLQHVLDTPDFDRVVERTVVRFSPREELWREWELHFIGEASAGRVPTSAEDDQFYQQHKAALLEGTEVLWERGDTYYWAMRYRLANGEGAFLSEMQNAVSEDMTPLGPLPLVGRSELPPASQCERLAALDPTTSGKASADFPGYVEALFHAETRVLYLDFALAERRPYAETIQRVADRIGEHAKPLDGLWVESNSAGAIIGDLLQQELRDRGRHELVVGVNHRANKQERIAALGIFARRGQLRVVNDIHEEFVREWEGVSRNDDLLDALATIVLQLKAKGLFDWPGEVVEEADERWLAA
jgi:hypothetical protein